MSGAKSESQVIGLFGLSSMTGVCDTSFGKNQFESGYLLHGSSLITTPVEFGVSNACSCCQTGLPLYWAGSKHLKAAHYYSVDWHLSQVPVSDYRVRCKFSCNLHSAVSCLRKDH